MRKPNKRVPCPECGCEVGNLFLHQKAKHPVRKPLQVERIPLENMFDKRNQLVDELDALDKDIAARMEELGLQFTGSVQQADLRKPITAA